VHVCLEFTNFQAVEKMAPEGYTEIQVKILHFSSLKQSVFFSKRSPKKVTQTPPHVKRPAKQTNVLCQAESLDSMSLSERGR
jgi:hypothetical protein